MRIDHCPSNAIPTAEAARRMGVSPQRARQLAESAESYVVAWKGSDRSGWFFDPVTVDAYAEERRAAGRKPRRSESVPAPVDLDVPNNVHDLLVRSAEDRAEAAEASLEAERSAHTTTRIRLESALRSVAELEERLRKAEKRSADAINLAQTQNAEVGRALRLLAEDVTAEG